jgi:hypothetical protein
MAVEIKFNVGDPVWYFAGHLVHEATITDVRRVCEGEPIEFVMYSVKTVIRDVEQVHPSEVFARPAERKLLAEKIEEAIDLLQYAMREIEDDET